MCQFYFIFSFDFKNTDVIIEIISFLSEFEIKNTGIFFVQLITSVILRRFNNKITKNNTKN